MLDGGAGRILSAAPALVKYGFLNPDKEWYVCVHWWDNLYWAIPELQGRVLNPENPNVFEDYLWDATEVITPEPYKLPEYYRQEVSMSEAFDILINGKVDPPLPVVGMELSNQELLRGYDIIQEAKDKQGKDKTIIIQPYGSTAFTSNLGVMDFSCRSIPEKMYRFYVDELKSKYNVIYMGMDELHDDMSYLPQPNLNLREWASAIAMCDYFIGCDSVGQHIAKSFNKKASVFIAGTHEKNVSYPDEFHIIKRDIEMYANPMRISSRQSDLAQRINEKRLLFTHEEMVKSLEEIVINIES